MPFTEMEWIALIKEVGKTDLEIALEVGGGEKTVRSIKKRAREKPSTLADDIETLGLDMIEMPWPVEASAQARAMLRLIQGQNFSHLYRDHGFLARAAVDRVCDGALAEPMTKDDWGCLLLSYIFLLGMRLSRNATHTVAAAGWDIVTNRLLKDLKGREESWARLLRFKVIGNTVVTDWKKASPKERCSPRMQKRINSCGYFDALVAYNDVIPVDHVAPFNALAIASRLGWQMHYADLYARLVKADGFYKEFSTANDDEIDADFDDFLRWQTMQPAQRLAITQSSGHQRSQEEEL